MFKKILTSYTFIIPVLIYIVSLVIIRPWGNFAISDDLYYLTQVKAFSLGIFTKSALIGPTFILQGFLGLIWTNFFGLSYVSLRALTIIVSVLCIIGLDRILNVLGVNYKLRILSLLLLVFIPEFYSCSLTFMTENYFLMFCIWSLYLFLLFCKIEKPSYLLAASVLGGMSIMVRQYGIVLFTTYILVILLTQKKKVKIVSLLYLLVPFIGLGALGIFWPKYQSAVDYKSQNILLFFADFRKIFPRIFSLSIFPYVGYFTLPFTSYLFSLLKRIYKLLIAIIAVPTAIMFFGMNIFSIGNLFYLEGLNARLGVNIRENLFNNVPFKIVLAYFIALSFITILFYLVRALYKEYRRQRVLKRIFIQEPQKITLIVLLLSFHLIVMITDRVFDRYLLNFFILLVLFATHEMQRINYKINILSIFFCSLICLVTFLLTFDYYRVNQLKWDMAARITEVVKIDRFDVFVDNVYKSTTYIEKIGNYDGSVSVAPLNYTPKCFVQEYIKQETNVLNTFITKFEQKAVVAKYLTNPKIPFSELSKGDSNHFDKTDTLYFDEYYSSPIYNLLGKKTYVRAFCLNRQ
jgi:hypothetical protein